jgi:hypothetical protein
MVGRAADRAPQQVGDAVLEHLVGRKPDRVPKVLGCGELVDLQRSERTMARK